MLLLISTAALPILYLVWRRWRKKTEPQWLSVEDARKRYEKQRAKR